MTRAVSMSAVLVAILSGCSGMLLGPDDTGSNADAGRGEDAGRVDGGLLDAGGNDASRDDAGPADGDGGVPSDTGGSGDARFPIDAFVVDAHVATDAGARSDRLIGPRTVASTPLARGTMFAAPSGTGETCSAASPCDVRTAIRRARAGDVVFLRGGVYAITSNVTFGASGTSSAPVTFESYPGERAIFDGSTLRRLGPQIMVDVPGSWLVLRNFEVRNMPRRGMSVAGTHNLLEGLEIHHNALWGLQLHGSEHEVRDCISHNNSDVGVPDGFNGGMSDGITVLGRSILVSHCLVYANSDDGIDSWEGVDALVEYSIVHSNGLGGGDGHGFKMGGPPPSAGSVVRHSISYNNRAFGFNWNSGGPVVARNVTSVDNGGFGFYVDPPSTIADCIAAENGSAPASGGMQTNNSWQRSGTADFISRDPASPSFLRPRAGSAFEGIGAYAGL